MASTRGATVEFRDVSKRYPGQLAVDRLSFKVPAGKICILVGPSGSGKTTSLKMVNRLIEPSGGSILIDGQDVLHKEPTALRRSIGYVIQHRGFSAGRRGASHLARSSSSRWSVWTRRDLRTDIPRSSPVVSDSASGSREPSRPSRR